MNKIVEDYRLEGAEGRADRGRAAHPTLFSGHFVQSIVHPMMVHRTSVWPLLAEGHPFFEGIVILTISWIYYLSYIFECFDLLLPFCEKKIWRISLFKACAELSPEAALFPVVLQGLSFNLSVCKVSSWYLI